MRSNFFSTFSSILFQTPEGLYDLKGSQKEHISELSSRLYCRTITARASPGGDIQRAGDHDEGASHEGGAGTHGCAGDAGVLLRQGRAWTV